MDQFFSPTNLVIPPPTDFTTGQSRTEIPLLTELKNAYLLWHSFLNNLPRHTKFTLGTRIDNLFADCLELSLVAGYTAKENKSALIQKLSAKFDALKFFLQILWEIKGLNNQKYSTLSQMLTKTGKMIGGWRNFFKNAPQTNG